MECVPLLTLYPRARSTIQERYELLLLLLLKESAIISWTPPRIRFRRLGMRAPRADGAGSGEPDLLSGGWGWWPNAPGALPKDPSGWGGSGEPDHAAHVVGDVGEADLHLGPSEADCADHQCPGALSDAVSRASPPGPPKCAPRAGRASRPRYCAASGRSQWSHRRSAPHGDVARGPELRLDRRASGGLRPGQRLAETPYRVGVRHAIRQDEPEEAHEREPVLDQILGPLVRQRVASLQDQMRNISTWS